MRGTVRLLLFLFAALGPSCFIRADAFIYKDDTFTRIPELSEAIGVNDAGQILGFVGTSAVIDTNGVLTKLDLPGTPYGFNNLDQFVGWFYTGMQSAGFLYEDGVFTEINVSGSIDTFAKGINNVGQIVGVFGQYPFGDRGFVYENGSFTIFEVPGSRGSTNPSAINDVGQIVGSYVDPASGYLRGFLDSNDVYTTITVPDSSFEVALSINNVGQIIGWSQDSLNNVHGFIDANGVFTTLDFPSSTSTVPQGINDAGEIVGNYTPAPEPASLLLLVVGFAVICKRLKITGITKSRER